MARIRALKQASRMRVVIAGSLKANDMRRLEHACSDALASPDLQLVLDISRVTAIDAVAEAHLRHIARRGAEIRGAG
jgi:anti-anti-sigma regulatory factor